MWPSKSSAALLLAGLAAVAPAAEPPAVFFDRHGGELRRYDAGERRAPVALEAVSPWLVVATLAAEDKRFFDHRGVDVQAVMRAALQNAHAGRIVSGGSTLTQQLVRQLEPRPRTLTGKAREAWRALRLERKAGKAEILEAYLNTVFYGQGAYGVEAAAQIFFQLPARDLSLAQAALLAGLPKSPTAYNPFLRRDAAVARQKVVLARLQSWGWIDAGTAEAARREPLPFSPAPKAFLAPHLTDQLRAEHPAGRWTTTVDGGLQAELEALLPAYLEKLSDKEVGNGAIVVLDNASGDVLAWVGSRDYFDARGGGQVDGGAARRQPGSAVKPFLFGLAFARGARPGDIIEDTPLYTKGRYAPRNYDERYHGRVSLREALANSYNIPAVRLIERFGPDALLGQLRDAGLTTLDKNADEYGLGLALGNAEVRLVDLANAYATLARGGVWKPVRRGPEEELPPARRALDRASAYLVTNVLADNSARARAFGLHSPFQMPFAFAAKTGTTKDYRDNWALGYTPRWTVGVWVGNFDGKPMRRVSGITGAGPLLRDAALAVARRYPSGEFERPREIADVEICPESGNLPSVNCPTVAVEVYAKANPIPARCEAHDAAPPQKSAEDFRLVFPRAGDIFKIDPAVPRASQAIKMRVEGKTAGTRRWLVDGVEIASGEEAWWPLKPGRHKAQVIVEEDGRRITRAATFQVIP